MKSFWDMAVPKTICKSVCGVVIKGVDRERWVTISRIAVPLKVGTAMAAEMMECACCEGCDIVQSDHAPQAGVAQGIFHGDLIRRRDGHQVELEEELVEEVERRVRRDHSRNKIQVRMHG